MNVKLIAVDMDGTFLTSQNTYDKDRFMSQYQEMKARGIHFVVASGNQYYQLRSFFPDIHQELAFIAENGAYIVDQCEDSFVAQLSEADVRTVIDAINQYPEIAKVVCGKKSAYVLDSMEEDFFKVMNIYYHRLIRVPNYNSFDDVIFKVYLHCSENDFDQIFKELSQKIGHIMIPVDCGHYGIDLIIPRINKAHGVKHLMDKWGIANTESMAFGDSGNDLEMIEASTYGFALSNAKDKIKKIADYEIGSNEEGAVLDAIDWMLKGERMFQSRK